MARNKKDGPWTLTVDIGGSGIKAGVLDAKGNLHGERLRVVTPTGQPPMVAVGAILELVQDLRPFDRASVGFPGVIRDSTVRTAANLGHDDWIGFDLAQALEAPLGCKVRVLNDADLAGLGVVTGQGVELVITLGTGVGTGIYQDGRLGPHLELGHHPFRKGKTYEQRLGDTALQARGRKKWRKDLQRAIHQWRELTHFDVLYLGGGNAKEAGPCGDDVVLVTNQAALVGGVAVWRDEAATFSA